MEMTSTEKGRMAELIAMTAFMARGYTVMEPISAETWDFAATHKESHEHIRAQVKTITKRVRDGVEYYVCKGRRNTGAPYSLAECDVFVGVYEGAVYLLDNRELSEYWVRVDEADSKWHRMDIEYNVETEEL